MNAGTSSVDIQTNAPAGTQPFTFGINDLTSPLGLAGAVTTIRGNVGFELVDGAPDGVGWLTIIMVPLPPL